MPKSPSRTSKKKKYNARFPPARIKKIMQTDEEVGKVAAAVPVIISRALELFIESLVIETSKTTMTKNAKTLSTSHIKQTIATNNQFGFLRELVASVPDHQTEDNNGDSAGHDSEFSGKKGRGRPRKPRETKEGRKNRGESSKASSNTSEDEDEEEEDEDTETDEEGSHVTATASTNTEPTYTPPGFMGNSQNTQAHSLSGMSHAASGFSDGLQSMQSSMANTTGGIHHQQHTNSNLPSYHMPLYSPFVPSSSQAVPSSYPVLPQFQNSSYPPVMPPSSLPHFQPYTHHQQQQQHSGAHPQQSDSQQAHIQQLQPVNLSYLSQLTSTTTSESDDYDT